MHEVRGMGHCNSESTDSEHDSSHKPCSNYTDRSLKFDLKNCAKLKVLHKIKSVTSGPRNPVKDLGTLWNTLLS